MRSLIVIKLVFSIENKGELVCGGGTGEIFRAGGWWGRLEGITLLSVLGFFKTHQIPLALETY